MSYKMVGIKKRKRLRRKNSKSGIFYAIECKLIEYPEKPKHYKRKRYRGTVVCEEVTSYAIDSTEHTVGGEKTMTGFDEVRQITEKYHDRIYNKDNSKVVKGEELFEKGFEYLLKRQEERKSAGRYSQ